MRAGVQPIASTPAAGSLQHRGRNRQYELAYYRIPFYESREMFEDALAAVASGLRNDHLTHHGRYYKYDSVPIELHTKQRPNPPFWYGVSTEDSFRFAG